MFEDFILEDIGDAKVETKEGNPLVPFYFDNIFGRGSRPASGGPGYNEFDW